MESCNTPSHSDKIKFQFDYVSTPINSDEYTEKSGNLVANFDKKRCFTPVMSDICSPGLSPIDFQESSGEAQGKKDHFNFPLPIASTKQFKKISPTTRQQQSSNQKQLQQQWYENQVYSENSSFDLDLSTSTKMESSLDISSRSETSKCSSILNHTLNVTLLLKELGLGQHSEKFAKEGIDLEKFLKLKLNELKRLGLQSDEDCKAIIDMVGELNSTQALKV